MSSKIEVSREQLQRWTTGRISLSHLEEIRALLAAPVVERQPVDVLGYTVVGNRYAIAATKGEIIELHEGYANHMIELVDRKHVTRLQAELAELQATIARLETKVNNAINLDFERRAEIERLKGEPGEPVEWRYRFTHRGELSKWFPVDSYMKLYTIANDPAYEVQPLYTSQPAPVSVVSDETINNAKRYELLRSGPINDDDGGCLWVWDWCGENYEECGNSLSGEALDAAVDACLDKVKGLNQ